MIRHILAALLVIASPSAYAVVQCPTVLVVMGCKVVPGHSGMEGAPGWKDLDWDISKFHLDCRREVVPIQDTAEQDQKDGTAGAIPLNHDFSDNAQCIKAAQDYAPKWAAEHPGRYPMIGCPTPIYNLPEGCTQPECGHIIGYQYPGCPSEIAGMPVVCEEDSAI